MPWLTSLSAAVRRQLRRNHGPRRRDRGIGGRRAHLAQGLGLGAGDLVLGELHAPVELLLHRAAGFGGEDLGFLGGEVDDGFRLLDHVALLAAIIGQHLRGLFAQALGLFELLGDGSGAGVERGGELLVHAEIKHAADEQEERYRDPEFRLEDEFHGSSPSARRRPPGRSRPWTERCRSAGARCPPPHPRPRRSPRAWPRSWPH